jgi:hypothetical protein
MDVFCIILPLANLCGASESQPATPEAMLIHLIERLARALAQELKARNLVVSDEHACAMRVTLTDR